MKTRIIALRCVSTKTKKTRIIAICKTKTI